jgi:hypothetical protein
MRGTVGRGLEPRSASRLVPSLLRTHTGAVTKKPEKLQKPRPTPRLSPKRRWLTVAAVLGTIAAETAFMRRRGYSVGLHTVVRCRKDHLFTTIWIPGASLKSIRLGIVRFQYCPVGQHFTSVRPVKDAELTEEIRVAAALYHDVSIP